MGVIETEFLACPFCDKGQIECGHVPSRLHVRTRATATFGKSRSSYKTAELWIVKSGCSVCGKSAEEVEKELKRKGDI